MTASGNRPVDAPSEDLPSDEAEPLGVMGWFAGRRGLVAEALVLVVAIAARLARVADHGGLRGIMGYDCGVYFAGADAFIHGRVPYRDFTMVHPPGILLVLTPFAELTRWMTDWHAFIVATLAFVLLGGVNAILVVRVCRRLGFGTFASGVGGLFYAAWYSSVSAEFEVKLEPLGNLFLLCGLLLLLRAQRVRTGWMANVVAGAVLGLTLTVKIWWGVPVVLLLAWHGWRQRSIRAGAQTALGVAIPVLVIYTPFFLADPSSMYSSVVTDQLGRAPHVGTSTRIRSLTGLPDLRDHLSHSTMGIGVALFTAALLAVLILAWRASTVVRVLVALVVVQLIVLLVAPSWYRYYGDYIAVDIAVCVGAAASSFAGMRLPRLRLVAPLALTAAVAVIMSLVTVTGSMTVRPFPKATQLTRDVSHVKCVTVVNTTVLIRLNALTRGLEAGCPNWIDVTGRFLGLSNERRSAYLAIRDREETRYLRSGSAVMFAFGHRVHPAVAKAIMRDGVFARAGNLTIYRGQQSPHRASGAIKRHRPAA